MQVCTGNGHDASKVGSPLYNDDDPEAFFGGLGHVTVANGTDYFQVAAPSPAIA